MKNPIPTSSPETGGVLPAAQIKRLFPDVELPRPILSHAVGFDVAAYLVSETGRHIQLLIPPRTSRRIPTGLAIIPPPGYYFQVCSRSGIAASQPPVFVANAPGIIDPDYTGELQIILFNGGHESVYIKNGDRIAQIILTQHIHFQFKETETLPNTERGSRGFGSTGG